jgi:hypothetical protein
MRQVLDESADRRTCGRPCSSTLPAACGARVPRRDALQPTLSVIKQTVTARLIEFLAGNLDALSAGLDADVVNTLLSDQLSQVAGVQSRHDSLGRVPQARHHVQVERQEVTTEASARPGPRARSLKELET